MRVIEALLYILLFGYIALGIGYIIRRGLSLTEFNAPMVAGIPRIGIQDSATVNIDHLFEEQGIFQIEL